MLRNPEWISVFQQSYGLVYPLFNTTVEFLSKIQCVRLGKRRLSTVPQHLLSVLVKYINQCSRSVTPGCPRGGDFVMYLSRILLRGPEDLSFTEVRRNDKVLLFCPLSDSLIWWRDVFDLGGQINIDSSSFQQSINLIGFSATYWRFADFALSCWTCKWRVLRHPLCCSVPVNWVLRNVRLQLTAEDATLRQLDALQINDQPYPDHGVEVMYRVSI